MLRTGILNQDILNALGSLGHTQTIVISDAGLPIPLEVDRIDLTVVKGIPSLMSVLEPVFNQVCVEKVYMSEDVQKANPAVLAQVRKLIGDIPIEFMSHMDFKEKTHTSNAIIRTGECTPFANVMLQITVDFS